MRQVRIRNMEEGDVPDVLGIARLSFSTPWSADSFLAEIHKSRSIARVAALGERVIGYICAEQILEECHILDLAVHPDFRRMKIATSLAENVMEEMRRRGGRSVYLEVRVSNAAAKALYERLGFRVAGMRKDYYALPVEDAIIMTREL